MRNEILIQHDRKNYFALYRLAHREQIKKYNNDYYSNHKDLIRARQRRYYCKAKAKKANINAI